MNIRRKLLLVRTGGPVAADDALDLARLQNALRERGAVIEEFDLGTDPGALLDHLAAGAVPVVFRTA